MTRLPTINGLPVSESNRELRERTRTSRVFA